jgi:hypothetical protein
VKSNERCDQIREDGAEDSEDSSDYPYPKCFAHIFPLRFIYDSVQH